MTRRVLFSPCASNRFYRVLEDLIWGSLHSDLKSSKIPNMRVAPLLSSTKKFYIKQANQKNSIDKKKKKDYQSFFQKKKTTLTCYSYNTIEFLMLIELLTFTNVQKLQLQN